MMFVTLKSFGQDNIDLTAFDREYRRAFVKLPGNYVEMLCPSDRPPNDLTVMCRKFFRELKIWLTFHPSLGFYTICDIFLKLIMFSALSIPSLCLFSALHWQSNELKRNLKTTIFVKISLMKDVQHTCTSSRWRWKEAIYRVNQHF